MRNLRVNPDRLWDSLMELGKIGETANGGCRRLALTDLDKEGRELVIAWCRAAGCTVTIDRIGNIFARRPGRRSDLAPVMFGSHIDTVPTGGKFDGILGVLAGLEVIRTLNDAGIETDAPTELSIWTNEEGCRFPPGMLGSAVFAGLAELQFALERTDIDGITVDQELQRLGYAGPASVGGRPVRAFIELHVEQGPELEDTGHTIGIVTGSCAVRLYEVTITGIDSHIGPMPMKRRRNALVGAARVITEVNRIGFQYGQDARSSCNFIKVEPNVNNVIPGKARLNADFRHKDQASAELMEKDFLESTARLSRELDMPVDVRRYWKHGPVTFEPEMVELARRTARRLGYRHVDLVTAGGHDAINMATCTPSVMIMAPSKDGLSHNEKEFTSRDDAAAGANVLLEMVVSIASDLPGARPAAATRS